jgi:hypothetical protein
MVQLGVVEVASLFPDISRNATPWISDLIDSVFMAPGGPVQALLAGGNWSSVCDRNGVPPAVIVAANRTSHPEDMAAVKVIAQQALTYPSQGKCSGLLQLPSGVIARSSGGTWHYPPAPPQNLTQITWPDDTFMCTAALSHAGAALGRGDMIDEAARRLLGV